VLAKVSSLPTMLTTIAGTYTGSVLPTFR